MVRFTLFCRPRGMNMRMEFGSSDSIGDLGATVEDYFGSGFILRNGYSMLGTEGKIGDHISDGDVVEVIPDPEIIIDSLRMGRTWRDWCHPRTSS